MRHARMVMATTIFLGITTGCVEMQRTCSSQEMIAMKEKGFSVVEIDNMCTSYKVKEESIQAVADVVKAMAANAKDKSKPAGSGNANAAAFSNNTAAYCTTQFGSCQLGTRASVGLACQCQTPFGAIPGVTQ